MKKSLLVFAVAMAVLCLAGCWTNADFETEDGFGYEVELNITNNSASEKSVSAEVWTLYDESAQKLYDCDPLTIAEHCKNEKYDFSAFLGECYSRCLSHIITIDDKKFAGFDVDEFRLYVDTASLKTGQTETISAEKTNLGYVNWSLGSPMVLHYEDETVNATEELPRIKIIYTVVINESGDIDITVSHELGEW